MADTLLFETDPRIGLSSNEAKKQLLKFGPNILIPKSPFAALLHGLKSLADPMVLLLLLAALVYFLLGEIRDGWVLVGSIVPILAVDLALEARTGRALKKIRELTAPTALVVRDGVEKVVQSETLVPGDVLVMKEGDILPVDGVLAESNNVEMDESPLTGESIPVPKDSSGMESSNVYAGTSVLSGQGKAHVTATGRETRYGQIGHLLTEIKEERTPLQKKIDRLVVRLLAWAVFVCLLVFAIEFYRGSGWGRSFLFAVSLAIAAVPEEFPVVFTLYLTMGVFRLARKKTLIRRMAGVETLGATTVICADKTGTLTEGKLTVAEHPEGENDELFWKTIVMACEPNPTDQLEKELVAHAREHGIEPKEIFDEWKLVRDYPFNVKGKYMSHVWRSSAGGFVICAKGAVEGILARCEGNGEGRKKLQEENEKLANTGMRVIAVAFGQLPVFSESREENERHLACLGVVGFSDPPRPEVARAAAECRQAGVRVVMVTGDHPLTAHHIAETVGLEHEDDQIVTGLELEKLNEEEFSRRASRANIFARVLPHHKHRLVAALKKRGEIVAMTGDGINDALALKEAHIGVAMGVRGTEVAREAATMVLLDDNFQTIVEAVKEGRQIFSKIEKAFRYLITFHTPIVFLAVAVPLLGLPLLLLPVVIIWLELIMHPTVALVFEADRGDPEAMKKPPLDPNRPILPASELTISVLTGLSIGLAVLGLYWYELASGALAAGARGMAVASLVIAEVFLVTIELSRKGVTIALKNHFFWITRVLTISVLLSFIYLPPMAQAMQLAPIHFQDWLKVLAVALFSTFLVEGVLYFRRRKKGGNLKVSTAQNS
ncbi:MAG: cation-transporting P-type ATPase [candidate division Zixibacteria bacterium]|nr:cation-transporting P-type ATPase [candidate division Zixibacteria bacterium]